MEVKLKCCPPCLHLLPGNFKHTCRSISTSQFLAAKPLEVFCYKRRPLVAKSKLRRGRCWTVHRPSPQPWQRLPFKFPSKAETTFLPYHLLSQSLETPFPSSPLHVLSSQSE